MLIKNNFVSRLIDHVKKLHMRIGFQKKNKVARKRVREFLEKVITSVIEKLMLCMFLKRLTSVFYKNDVNFVTITSVF